MGSDHQHAVRVADVVDLAELLREALRTIAAQALEEGLDLLHPTVLSIGHLQGLVIELEQRVAPTKVRAVDDYYEDIDGLVDDPDLREGLHALRRVIGRLPAGDRPVDGRGARALRKAREEHILYDLLGHVRGARSDAAREDEVHYLYLVRYGQWQKFGRGTFGRVRSYGSQVEITAVRSAPFQHVKKAEDVLRDRHRHAPRPDRDEHLPRNFGALREVVASDIPIDLAEVLPDGADLTDLFRDLQARLDRPPRLLTPLVEPEL